MTDDTFQCAMCGGVFRKGRSDADAEAEAAELFPDVPREDCVMVCDPCFKQMGFQEGGRRAD